MHSNLLLKKESKFSRAEAYRNDCHSKVEKQNEIKTPCDKHHTKILRFYFRLHPRKTNTEVPTGLYILPNFKFWAVFGRRG